MDGVCSLVAEYHSLREGLIFALQKTIGEFVLVKRMQALLFLMSRLGRVGPALDMRNAGWMEYALLHLTFAICLMILGVMYV